MPLPDYFSYERSPTINEFLDLCDLRTGQLKAVIAVDLGELTFCSIDNAWDGLHDIANEILLDWSDPGTGLSRLRYRPVGAVADKNLVLIEVCADASYVLDGPDAKAGAR